MTETQLNAGLELIAKGKELIKLGRGIDAINEANWIAKEGILLDEGMTSTKKSRKCAKANCLKM